jgi:hypothetical protein
MMLYHRHMTNGDDELLTLAEAAERSGKSTSTLRTQIKRGILPGRKIGRDWVITAGALRRYIEERGGKPGYASPDHPNRKPAPKDA